MKTEKSTQDEIICFICDYPFQILGAILFLIVLAMVAKFDIQIPKVAFSPTVTPTVSVLPTSTPMPVAVITNTPMPTATATIVLTPSPTAEPTQPKPVYKIAMVPVSWDGPMKQFKRSAESMISEFIGKSNIEEYFTIEVIYADASYDLDIDSEYLLEDFLYKALIDYPADRYVAITDGSFSEGQLGYTFGKNYPAVAVQNITEQVTAHELGHTYGLCDEYFYDTWLWQNEEMGGCPNKFPPEKICPHTAGHWCDGTKALNGAFSMMTGYLGPDKLYDYNQESYDQLQLYFSDLLEGYSDEVIAIP